MTIPLFRAYVGKEELDNIKKVLDSGFLGKWKMTDEFEKRFADFVGAKYCVGTNSGTAALHLALMACGIKEGDEVLVPNLTFCSTALVVLYVGATPVWVDVNPDTLCMDPTDMARKITRKVKAVIPVHYGGTPADVQTIKIIIDQASKRLNKKIYLIEDSAQAAGGKYDSKRQIGCCRWSDLTCFSWESKKVITCGEGGAVTTNNPKLAANVERLAWLGITKGTKERMSKGYSWQYDVVDVNGFCGMKYHMADIEAAILLVQLKKIDRIVAARQKIVERYDKEFKNVPCIKTLQRPRGSACWNYAMILRGVDRKEFINFMTSKDISVGVHYEKLNHHSVFRDYKEADTPVADGVWSNIVVLPVFVDLTKKQQDYIIKCVKEFGDKHD